jgi:hypothetical protein
MASGKLPRQPPPKMKSAQCAIALGSNLGDSSLIVKDALKSLLKHPALHYKPTPTGTKPHLWDRRNPIT